MKMWQCSRISPGSRLRGTGGSLIVAQINDFGIGAVHGFSDMLVGPSQEEHHGDHQFRPHLHLASMEQLRVVLSA